MNQPVSSRPSSPHPIQPGFFRITDFMAYSGLGRSKVYDLIQKGAIQTVKVGRSTLIPRASIEEWETRLLTPAQRSNRRDQKQGRGHA